MSPWCPALTNLPSMTTRSSLGVAPKYGNTFTQRSSASSHDAPQAETSQRRTTARRCRRNKRTGHAVPVAEWNPSTLSSFISASRPYPPGTKVSNTSSCGALHRRSCSASRRNPARSRTGSLSFLKCHERRAGSPRQRFERASEIALIQRPGR